MSDSPLLRPVDEQTRRLLEKGRGVAWDVKDIREHDHYVEKFYNGAVTKCEAARKDICSIDFAGVRCDNNGNTNEDLERKLKKLRWTTNFSVGKVKHFKIDFYRDGVGLEVQLRQDTDLLKDLLKLELGYHLKNGLSCGVIITYDKSVIDKRGKKKSGMYASIQELDKLMYEFKDVISVTVPLWAIGIKPKQS